MKIINIDSTNPEEFTDHLQLTIDIMGVLMTQEQNSVLKLNLLNNDSLLNLIREIPIFLLQPESMPDDFHNFGYDQINNENEDNPTQHLPTEYIAFYTRAKLGYGWDIPAIYVCPERIEETAIAGGGNPNVQQIIAIIIFHEFAHAWLDSLVPPITSNYRDEFYPWMEEAMANFMTLKILKWYSEHENGYSIPLEHAIGFVRCQPVNYKLGNDFFNHNFIESYFVFWAGQKERILKKDLEKENWLSYVSTHVGRTTEDELLPLFEDLFRLTTRDNEP